MTRPPDGNRMQLSGPAARLAAEHAAEFILPQEKKIEGEVFVPVWVGQLISAYVVAPKFLITIDLSAMLSLVRANPERQQSLGALARFQVGAVETIALIEEWKECDE